MPTPPEARECPHSGKPHRHGTRAAYVADRCRCEPCRAANSRDEHERRRAIAYGRWRPYVDAGPARAHLEQLRARGIGLNQIARLAGVAPSTLTRLAARTSGNGASTTGLIRAEPARRILAVPIPVDANTHAPGSLVDATGSRRRLQALVAIGWTQADLARHLQRRPSNLRQTLHSQLVTAATAADVRDLYDRLWNHPPDQSTPRGRRNSHAAREQARRNGWLAPLAWDDIDLDREPAAESPQHRTPDDVDDLDIDILIDRLTTGTAVTLSSAERDVVVARLTDQGHSLHQIAALLGVAPRTVSRRRRANRAA